jgi:hypothetical protein
MSCGVFILMVLLTTTVHSVSPPSSREEVVRQIQSYAEAHVSTGTPMKDDSAVLLFRDNDVGLSPQEISKIYISRYREVFESSRPWWKRLPWWLSWCLLVLLVIARALRNWIEELECGSNFCGAHQFKKVYGKNRTSQ